MSATPAVRVAKYLLVRRSKPGPTDTIDVAANDSGVVADLTLADLDGVLAALADACDDHERCESCGQHMCTTCGMGEAADCPADRVHCTDPWCWCPACMDEAAADRYYEQQADLRGGRY